MSGVLLLPHHQGGAGSRQVSPGGRGLQGRCHQGPRPVGRQLSKRDLQREGSSSTVELEGGFSPEVTCNHDLVSQVYAYKKRQVCSSEVKFVVPGLARDTEGTWRVIVQSSSRNLLSQTFALDTCTEPDSPCPGLAECGRKSRCVQRYNYHLMLAIDTNQAQAEDCPSLRAFRLPSGCVCHAETHHAREEDINF